MFFCRECWQRVRLALFIGLLISVILGIRGEAAYAQAVQPRLVKDINGITANADPEEFTHVGNTLFYTADDGVHGRELWKTDGTPGGTVLVKDIWPGGDTSALRMLTAWQGKLYFVAYSGSPQRSWGLWQSDGTEAGTSLIKELQSGSSVYDATLVNNILYFNIDGTIWRSDGTAAETKPFKETFSALQNINPRIPKLVNGVLLFWADSNTLWKIAQNSATQVKQIPTTRPLRGEIVLNNRLLFAFEDDLRGYLLWQSDGTTNGTTMVKDITQDDNAAEYPWEPQQIAPDTVLFFVRPRDNATFASSVSLWKSNGAANGTVLVKQIQPIQTMNLSINHPTVIGNKLYWSVGSHFSPGDCELWQSDGTANGTNMVKAICPTSGITPVGNTIYFSANGGTDGEELWQSNGTLAGTVQVKDIRPGPDGSYPRYLQNAGSLLYFLAVDGLHGPELWKSDGTLAGTTLVKDTNPAAQDNNWPDVVRFHLWNGVFYFNADDGQTGTEVWRTTGDAANTHLLKDINSTTNSSYPTQLTAAGNQLFFLTQLPDGTPNGAHTLWKTEGSLASTSLITQEIDILDTRRLIDTLAGTDQHLYFSTQLYRHSAELWITGGSATPPQRLIQLSFPEEFSGPRILKMLPVGNLLYFVLERTHPDAGLWKSDGTPGGTQLIKKFSPPNPPQLIIAHKGILYFDVINDAFQHELWRSDGTEAGTFFLKNVWVGAWSGVVNDKVYLFGNGNNQLGLWQSDGTVAGTTFVTTMGIPLAVLNNVFYFFESDGISGRELWKNAGTPGAQSELVKDINPGPGDSRSGASTRPFALFQQAFYFTANDGVNGDQLWKSDGTANGTVLVKAIANTAVDSFDPIVATSERVYFLRITFFGDRELWGSDGTDANTQRIMNLNDDFVGKRPGYAIPLQVVNDRLYFTGSDGQTGIELWTIASSNAATATDDTYTTSEDTLLQVAAPGVLSNDQGSGVLTASLSSGPAHGTAQIKSDGSFVYTPTLNFHGVDTLVYSMIAANNSTASATISITVTPVNDAPTATNDSATTTKDTPILIPVLTNDQDVDDHPLTLTSLTQPAHGSAAIVANQISYTPTTGYEGSDSLTYTVSDGQGGTSQGAVTIQVAGADADRDGLADAVECPSTPCPNTDSDGHANGSDIDSDGDGIPDLLESQPTNQMDAAAMFATPIDSDGDQTPDHLDSDSDNDTIPDAVEGHDANNDGKADRTPLNRDSDNDGLDDVYDTVSAPAANNASGSNVALIDLDQDQKRNWQDADDDGDGVSTVQEGSGDADQDGVPDYLDSVAGGSSRAVYLSVIRK